MTLEEAIKILKNDFSNDIEPVRCWESENCYVFEVDFKGDAVKFIGIFSSIFVVWKDNGNCYPLGMMNEFPPEGAGMPIKEYELK